ncbi:DUF2530 domain-containing protein [Saccharopolyspora oryzae]|uniref:DUF2530 domain-containing protein n=1 Tax=Saccharopolyspora oryzae TaxID=2997343 RepID=A0ABT4V9Z5_9PSEU|nr:DUF2530 domain-containing protein [Saccharopolyspora oryzae]MDA3630794.1 DUF2530 domain-containing protein [Saccharopolyspora oryzae]
MAKDSEPTPTAAGHRPVPHLPRRLADPTPVVLTGTALWLLGVLLFAVRSDLRIEFWTCLAGVVLGVIGYGVFRWQRSAARRGSRGAWQGLSGLDG